MPDPVKDLLTLAKKNDYDLDEEAAQLYLVNQVALSKNPNDAEARRIANHFTHHVFAARSFTKFIEDEETPECPECIEYGNRDAKQQYIDTLVRGGMELGRAQEVAEETTQKILEFKRGLRVNA